MENVEYTRYVEPKEVLDKMKESDFAEELLLTREVNVYILWHQKTKSVRIPIRHWPKDMRSKAIEQSVMIAHKMIAEKQKKTKKGTA